MNNPPLAPEHLHFTRTLHLQTTCAERLLWQRLRDRRLAGCKFRRQHPMAPYVLDFYCDAHRLVIELDGSRHVEVIGQQSAAHRDAWLEACGLKVLRFSDDQVLKDLPTVLEQIWQAVQTGRSD